MIEARFHHIPDSQVDQYLSHKRSQRKGLGGMAINVVDTAISKFDPGRNDDLFDTVTAHNLAHEFYRNSVDHFDSVYEGAMGMHFDTLHLFARFTSLAQIDKTKYARLVKETNAALPKELQGDHSSI